VQLDGACAEDGGQRPCVLLDRLVEAPLFEQRVGASEDRLGLGALVGGDPVLEETGVDPETQAEPLDRLSSRARLPPLDLRDVLLGEAVAGELGLCQTGCDAKLAQAFAETRCPCRLGSPGRNPACGARSHQLSEHGGRFT